MILDERTEFADATAMNTGGAATYLIGDVIDLSVARDIGQGQPVYLVVQMTTAATSGGSATARFQLASDSVAAIATDGTQTVHMATEANAVADMTLGFRWVIPVPGEGPAYERFLGFQQVTATAAFTAGAVNAFLTTEPSSIPTTSYADAIN